MYTENQRRFQERFETTALADTIEQRIVEDRLNEKWAAFVAARDMVFVASVDERGRPACSYKGGAPGFVKLLDDRTLIFPLYDGNGMFVTAGNIVDTPWIGLLFVDFETPNRLRINGTATVTDAAALLAQYPEAKLVVRVAVKEVFVNCARYVHQYRKVETSPFVPKDQELTPVAGWKMLDFVLPILPQADRDEIERRRREGLPLPEPSGERGRE